MEKLILDFIIYMGKKNKLGASQVMEKLYFPNGRYLFREQNNIFFGINKKEGIKVVLEDGKQLAPQERKKVQEAIRLFLSTEFGI